jgi:hypothetical protein
VNADTAVVVPGASGWLSGTGYFCAAGECTAFDISHSDGTTTGTATLGPPTATSEAWLSETTNADWRAIALAPQPGVLRVDSMGDACIVLETTTVTEAAVSVDGGDFLVFAATGADPVVAWGDPAALDEATIPFTDGTSAFVPTHVAVYADEDRVLLAASAGDGVPKTDTTVTPPVGAIDPDDQVGWVFLRR